MANDFRKVFTQSDLPLGDEAEVRRRQGSLIWLSGLVLLGVVIGVAFILYQYLVNGFTAWQILVTMGAIIFGGASAVWGIFLARSKRVMLGAWQLIVCLWLAALLIGVVISDIEQILSLVVLLSTLLTANWVLSQRSVLRVVIMGVVLRFVGSVGAYFLSAYAWAIPGLSNLLPVVLGVALAGMGLFIFVQFRSFSLGNKLVLIFLLLALVSSSILSTVDLIFLGRALRANVGASLVTLANTQSRIVGDILVARVDALRALATNEILQSAVSEANAAYTGDAPAIRKMIDEYDLQWIQSISENQKDNPFILARLDNEAAIDLREYRQVFAGELEMFITDRHGGLVAATEATSDYNQADEVWWQVAYNLGLGATYISSPEFDRSRGETGLVMAVPIYDRETHDLIGVLRSTYSLDELRASLSRAKLGDTGEVDLYFPGQVIQFIHAGGLGLADSQTIGQMRTIFDQAYGEIVYEGVSSMVSRSWVVSTSGNDTVADLGLYVVSHQNSTEALASLNEQRRISLLVVAFLVGVISLSSIGLAQLVTRPVSYLTAMANRVRQGDLDAQVDVRTNDEVGVLGATFNSMASELRQTLKDLEKRVTERTRELSLAGETGRAISQLRDLDALLSRSVELIQFSFDLYYAQVYLLDPGGRSLVLRAGTGTVGVELLRRQHRLAVGVGSINGSVAAEKRAVIVSDTTSSLIFKPNPLLPNTRSEMAIPLLVGDRLVGVLDLQSEQAGKFSEENLPAFDALASQLAIAIDNAMLFTQAEAARLEVQTQARRLTTAGWRDYLDAVEHSERIGYSFEKENVVPLKTALDVVPPANSLEIPIQVAGETVGVLRVEAGEGHVWDAVDKDLVSGVASQVARQVENLRLLSQAERYRVEAEAIARQQTREGWQEYLRMLGVTELGFVYDQERIYSTLTERDLSEQTHVEKTTETTDAFYRQPVLARGQAIGELAVTGGGLSDDDQNLLQVVAEQLGAHIDALRLSAQTQAALATTEALYQSSERIVRASKADDVLRALVESTALSLFEKAIVVIFDHPWVTEMPETGIIVAMWDREKPIMAQPRSITYALSEMPFVAMMHRNEPLFIEDVQSDARMDAQTKRHMERLGNSLAVFPLVAGDQWIGWLAVSSTRRVDISSSQIRQIQSLTGQAAAVLQSVLLLEQSQARARYERVLREVTARVRESMDTEVVLRTAAQELGSVLGRNVLVRLGGAAAPEASEVGSAPGNGKKDESRQ